MSAGKLAYIQYCIKSEFHSSLSWCTQCNLLFPATGAAGLYAVALQIEDFATPTSTLPLSSVPLQFLVFVSTSNTPCSSRPEFVPPTRVDASCIGVPFNTTYDEPIIAQSGGETIR